MSSRLEILEQDVLSLRPHERAFLADRLLSSLSGETLSEVETAWVEEAQRRYQGYKAGGRPPVPAVDVLADADELLR